MRGRKRGPKKGSKRNSRKPESSKGQRTLFEYIEKPPEPEPQIPIERHEEESFDEPEPNILEETKEKLVNFVKIHQLNEILVYFQFPDHFLLRFSLADIKSLYEAVQNEMINEFGAPLSPSLFPQHLWSDTEPPNSFQSNSQSQAD
ncbi:hypothetical protein TVAGG3_0061580 [Trichomonas vaginalis G3]|uniref:hypothetical protein n=1 Tax=Trichomonas vaginalis (strain ATCC PRA-98 / G3) TaxID=412133 RepID=UPI0021E5F5E9|nr:hypothetical protein TVAGG3_0061580 [Trichomonas vaginalis G3]KAI5542048.1 hypothetical protein TVAGG3_0061580 [Trichomonas vaginalis G3]